MKSTPLNLFAAIALLALGTQCSQPAEAPAEDETAVADAAVETPIAEAPMEEEVTSSFETYSAAAFFETTSYLMGDPSGLGFSADGSHILISSDQTGVFNAGALDASGSYTAITTSAVDATWAQSYFPNDDRVIVEADQGGNELDHVYVRELDGTMTDLTPGEELKAFFIGWRNDREAFFVATNERDNSTFDVYSYNAETFDRDLMYENPGLQIGGVSASGRWIALDRPRTSADSDILLVDLAVEAPEPVLITEHEGNIAYGTYTFTPDETQLVFATDEHGEFNQAWTYDLASGERAALIEADWDVAFVIYSPSGRYRVHATNDDGLTNLTIFDNEAGAPVSLNGLPDGELGQVRFSRDESQIAFGVNTDTSPRNVYLADLATGDTTRLTDALNPAIDEANLVEATVVRYTSYDGLEIPSIFYRPVNASAENPVPAIVWVHGGPGGQSTRGYSATIQHLVNHGYAVLAANNRGSSGYGKTFFHMDDRRHGEADLGDIVFARAYLESLDWVDGDAMGILGGSYGGYMVAAALAFEPEAFDVGVNVFGVTNWVRTLDSIPPWWEAFREALYDEMGDPATDGERHRRISPLFHAENIVRPMLVVQGANDPRVLQVESDELVEAVRANGVPVEYVLFPDEGHGFARRENRITASEAYLTFLDTYLRSDGEADGMGEDLE